MKGGFEPATLESQVEHSTTEPKPLSQLKATHLVTHTLTTTTDTPIRVKRHRHPPAIKEEIQRQINKYLDERIIRPSDSPYSLMMWVGPEEEWKESRNEVAHGDGLPSVNRGNSR